MLNECTNLLCKRKAFCLRFDLRHYFIKTIKVRAKLADQRG